MKNILLIFLLFFCFTAKAQQGLQMEFEKKDSAQIRLERQIQYQQLISGTLNTNFIMDEIEMPKFNFNNELKKRWSLNSGLNSAYKPNIDNFVIRGFNLLHSPFYHNSKVLSSAAYQIGDKFTFGGYSFGANSIFSAPLPNQGMNNFDINGSTLFMEYKVSKKFKIETRISVTQDKGNRF